MALRGPFQLLIQTKAYGMLETICLGSHFCWEELCHRLQWDRRLSELLANAASEEAALPVRFNVFCCCLQPETRQLEPRDLSCL
jgi:hypothetical protein